MAAINTVSEADLRDLLAAMRAVRDGDFSVRLPARGNGPMGEIRAAFNEVAELNAQASDDIRRVTGAVVKGDLTQQIALESKDRPIKGDFLKIGESVNGMVAQLGSFSAEVSRVAREVGTEGALGGQAKVEGVSGAWKELTDNVNSMASNLTNQVRNFAQVATAVARGDLSQKITVEAKGEVAAMADTLNSVTDTLSSFAAEVTRVAREVGTEGILGGQAEVPNVSGVWKGLTDNVNVMASNLTTQVRNIAQVARAMARGDLSQQITVEAKGEVAAMADTLNLVTDTLRAFADEVTRVAREVGTEGKLGGQARVEGVSGTWKDLTDSVNSMASNLTGQVRDIAQVTTAVANGDLSQKITVDVRGEMLELKNTINTMVDQLSSFAAEVTRVAREVGTEGKLGGQAEVEGVSGTWRHLTENVNSMASNLTGQVRNISQVAMAVARGDLSQKITVEAKGEVAVLAETINSMTDTLRAFADEVTRVAREVGTEGKLGGQARVQGVSGTWSDLTDNVNFMASNLTNQVRAIAQVTTAVANGDLSQKITVDVKGEIAELKDTINTMVDQLSSFAAEVTRVAREVGTEGRLGGQAEVEGVSGTWRHLTENVNSMASNLTGQVRAIAQVTTAVAKGDLSQKITVDVKGEIAELKDTINTMVDQLSSFADEVTRVAREVGTEGILGGQAEVEDVSGTWRQLTQSVNSMASNLTGQVRNISQVATAVARGDLTQKITVEAKGEVAVLAETINSMTDTLRAFADEVTRVAREVGTEGRLGGQARVEGVAGTWKNLTDSVNFMASNLTSQVRNIAQVATAVAKGDLTQKITVEARAEILELKNTINTMVDQLSSFADEVTRVAREVGTEGKLGGQARVQGVSGTWRDLTDSVNSMASNLTGQVRNIAQVTTAVAKGDLTRHITVDVKGELAELKDTINTMVDRLSSFADEVTRVAREVGTEGKLGGQARVKGVSGTWKDLTDSVNVMADSLTAQVRDIAQVTTAVATGNLSKKITVNVRGELQELKDTINTMVDQLSSFAAEVTRVAREVGTEGKLGGQARVRGVSGTWKDLTDNVNIMADSLTAQVRAITEVATAVTQGDLTRSITVKAQGEVAALTETINQMIGNLAETTQRNKEQDWLKTNVARISSLMQGQRDLQTVSRLIMSELTPTVGAQHGAFFLRDIDDADHDLRLVAGYGYSAGENRFKLGDSLVGQAAVEKAPILVTNAPPDYVRVRSGLGEAVPVNLIVLPILFEDDVLGVIELASLRAFNDVDRMFLGQVIDTIGVVLSTIIANTRTEELLTESQRLAAELQAQQEELRQTNQELQENARLLADQNRNIEVKNREIEIARLGLEEKAQQLALSSKYKSEFLANMSHELRTPLNSLLILAKLLADNQECNLTERQVEFAHTIQTAGTDLLNLINDILDVSKVEAGRMAIVPTQVRVADVCAGGEESFRLVAEERKLEFTVEKLAGAPEVIVTDEQRLQQILRNLLSNAFKFTERGSVRLSIGPAPSGVRMQSPVLLAAEHVVAFSVTDTGIGIPSDKLQLMFEAFQQADGTTSRKYGGTGLGLSISREIARLLGGELQATSRVGEGSVFTLYLPHAYEPPPLPQQPGPGLALSEPARVGDDRDSIAAGDRTLLIVESDEALARAAIELGREHGFKTVMAPRGPSALALARDFSPDAILLDTELPYMDGGTLLTLIKQDAGLRHIPVHVLAPPDARQDSLRGGAFGFTAKPVGHAEVAEAIERLAAYADGDRRLLVVACGNGDKGAISPIFSDLAGVEVAVVTGGEEALGALRERRADCIVVDLQADTATGCGLLEQVSADEYLRTVPVIAYTGQERPGEIEARLASYAPRIVLKEASSLGHLFDEVTLFLHRASAHLPDGHRIVPGSDHEGNVFEGKKALIVDDDIRNVFALTSVLEREGMAVLFAENGRDGLATLEEHPDIAIVLMDVMMPEMDGHEATAAIRLIPRFATLPIIALTAKAMKGDREQSIAAGASDYIAKPVDVDQLLSLMRVWLSTERASHGG